MNPTSATFVRVAHVVTWTARDGAHEGAVNARLADLSGKGTVVGIEHSATMTETPEGESYQFSTLITYRCFPEEDETE
jgi:hypothetical protein